MKAVKLLYRAVKFLGRVVEMIITDPLYDIENIPTAESRQARREALQKMLIIGYAGV